MHGTFKPYMSTFEEEKKQNKIREFESNLMMNRALLKEIEHKSADIKRLKELASLPKGPRSRQLYSHLFAERMMIKNKPSSEWPMIRMGSLREAGVTTADNTGNEMLNTHQLHHCKNDLIFKTQDFAVLASSRAVQQILSQVP